MSALYVEECTSFHCQRFRRLNSGFCCAACEAVHKENEAFDLCVVPFVAHSANCAGKRIQQRKLPSIGVLEGLPKAA